MLKTTEPPINLSAKEFIDILQGKYLGSDSVYAKFYKKYLHSDEINIKVSNVIVIDKLELRYEVIFPFFVEIENSIFKEEIIFTQGVFKDLLTFSFCVFEQDVFLTALKFHYFGVKNVVFKGLLSFQSTSFEDFVLGRGVYQNVKIERVNVNTMLLSGVYESLSINNCLLNKTIIGENNKFTFVKEFLLNVGSEISNIQVSDIQFNTLTLTGNCVEKNVIEIRNIKLHKLMFDGFRNNGRLTLSHIFVESFEKKLSDVKVQDYYNKLSEHQREVLDRQPVKINLNDLLHYFFVQVYGTDMKYVDEFMEIQEELLLKNADDSEGSLLEINKATLGNCELKNVELDKFKVVKIIDTDLSTLKFFNSRFAVKSVKGTKDSYQALYETFNDLYTVVKNQNNKRDQIEYYKASQENLLHSYLTKENRWKKIPSIISLFIAKWYSNFGTRWTQAFFVTPLIAFLFFLPMMLCSNYDVDFSAKGWTNFQSLSVYYIQYLNPVHKLNFMDKAGGFIFSQSFPFVLLDFLGRIFVSIGIYEVIRSFRKYVRS